MTRHHVYFVDRGTRYAADFGEPYDMPTGYPFGGSVIDVDIWYADDLARDDLDAAHVSSGLMPVCYGTRNWRAFAAVVLRDDPHEERFAKVFLAERARYLASQPAHDRGTLPVWTSEPSEK